MLNISDAEHEETAPEASQLLINKLTCSLVGETQIVNVRTDTLAHHIYGQNQIEEQFSCNYGLNPAYEEELEKKGLKITGRGEDREARIVELSYRPFFIATLFVPQLSSTAERPHPLIVHFLDAAKRFQVTRARAFF